MSQFLIHILFITASKTETLDLCQLPRPPDKIHNMIYLPASVKISKNKLKNRYIFFFTSLIRQKNNNKLIRSSFELPQGFLESDFKGLHAWTTVLHIFQYKFNQFENRGL